MYEIDLFAEHLRKKGTPNEKINRAIDEIIHFLNAPNSDKEPLDSLKEYCDKHITFPALGSDLARYPDSIIAYLSAMQSRLSIEDCQNVLAGNHHDIDPERSECSGSLVLLQWWFQQAIL